MTFFYSDRDNANTESLAETDRHIQKSILLALCEKGLLTQDEAHLCGERLDKLRTGKSVCEDV